MSSDLPFKYTYLKASSEIQLLQLIQVFLDAMTSNCPTSIFLIYDFELMKHFCRERYIACHVHLNHVFVACYCT